MLERLTRLLQRLRFDPGKTSLSWFLALSQVAVVLLVAGGIASYAVEQLRDLANQEGKARVQLAGAMAREDLRRMGEDALTSARVLADRPTLLRLLTENRPEALVPFLRRFCESETIDGCAVFDGTTLVAQAGPPTIPWSDVVAANAEQGQSFLAVPAQAPAPLLGAVASLTDRPTARVFIVRLLDAKVAQALSHQVGLEVRLVNYRTFTTAPVDALTSLHTAGLADG
ncbi:MAG TPA: hypothetical protein VNU73_05470, partial [Steroidobacteraceae bacterium]|nr:hypothetical protein [Steroidobacteraceae bacterium]